MNRLTCMQVNHAIYTWIDVAKGEVYVTEVKMHDTYLSK